MTLKDAKLLRDKIKATGPWTTVPLGHGPDGYFVRIITDRGPKEFRSWRAYRAYRQSRMLERLDAEAAARRAIFTVPQSPIEIMIDQACGVTHTDH